MNWLNRYVTAVKNYLPSNARDDVGRELLSLLEDKMEAEEERKGRPLNEEEELVLLKEMGHPAKAAAGYHQTQTLISEESFPFYKQTLKYALLGVFVAYSILAALGVTAAPDFRITGEIYRALPGILDAGTYAFTIVTLIFCVVDRVFKRRDFFSDWAPRKLPKAEKSWAPIPLHGTIPSVIFTVLFLAVINGLLPSLGAGADGKGPAFGQSITNMLPYINVILLCSISLRAYNLFQPYWTVIKLVANAFLGLATCAVVIVLLGFDGLIVARNPSAEAASFFLHLQTLARTVLVIVLLVALYETVRDIYRACQLQYS